MQDSALGTWVAGSTWGYPIVLACHAVGMAVAAGTVTMICLRILGFARAVSLTMFARLSAVAWAGLVLNVVTGLALFAGDPVKFFCHPVFRIKIALITLGAVSLWILVRALRAAAAAPEDGSGMPAGSGAGEAGTDIKTVSTLSFLFWIGVIILGRFIPYVE